MKLGTLINNRQVFDILYKARLDGRRTLQLRKILKSFAQEIDVFNELKDERIKAIGKKDESGNYIIEPDTPEYGEILGYMNELAASEIPDPEPVLEESDLEKLNVSSDDIDRMEALGLIRWRNVNTTELDRPNEVEGSN